MIFSRVPLRYCCHNLQISAQAQNIASRCLRAISASSSSWPRSFAAIGVYGSSECEYLALSAMLLDLEESTKRLRVNTSTRTAQVRRFCLLVSVATKLVPCAELLARACAPSVYIVPSLTPQSGFTAPALKNRDVPYSHLESILVMLKIIVCSVWHGGLKSTSTIMDDETGRSVLA